MTMSSLDIQNMVGIMQRIEEDKHIPFAREWVVDRDFCAQVTESPPTLLRVEKSEPSFRILKVPC